VEMVTVRMDTTLSEPLSLILSQHGDSVSYTPSKFKRVNDQFIVYSSRHGHANYPSEGENLTSQSSYSRSGFGVDVGLENLTKSGGFSWDCGKNYRIIAGIPSAENPQWNNFLGGTGPKTISKWTADQLRSILLTVKPNLPLLLPIVGVMEILAITIASGFIADKVNMDEAGPAFPKAHGEWTYYRVSFRSYSSQTGFFGRDNNSIQITNSSPENCTWAIEPTTVDTFQFRHPTDTNSYFRIAPNGQKGAMVPKENTPAFVAETTFKVCPGFGSPASLSFESVAHPGLFLREKSPGIILAARDTADFFFDQSASFMIAPPLMM